LRSAAVGHLTDASGEKALTDEKEDSAT